HKSTPNPSPRLVDFQSLLKQTGRQKDSGNTKLIEEFWTDVSWLKCANHSAARPNAFFVETENLMHADHVFFHSGNLGNARHLATAIAQPGNLNDDSDGRSDLLANCSLRNI